MREYLFRGKKWDNSEWIYGDLIQGGEESSIWILPIEELRLTEVIKIIPETVCQFSGHQVNGINLYESDIVRNEKMEDEYDTAEYLVCVFIKEWAMFGLLTIEEYHKYNKEGAEALDETMFWTFPINDIDNEQRRICGNIYSHPELLQSL
jgi:hypothetical protein